MRKQGNKIVVVGAGQVGATTAYTLLVSGLVSDLVLIDLNQKKAQGEVLDLAHGIPLCPPADIKVGDYPDCENADIVVLTAGANQKPGETRLRYLLSQHTGVDPRNVHTYVLGEHGDTELPAWSLTSIAGMGMDEYCSLCASCQGSLSQTVRAEFDDKVRNAAYRIIEGKGATFYAVALAVRRIVEAILRNEQSILTVSSLLTGQYGLDGVCLSLPCIVGVNGVEQVLPIHLSDEEMAQLRTSADAIRAAIRLMDEPVE